MPVNSELDLTPEFTPSTIQFSNEILNTIVTSLITVFIIVNFGSAVSKLVYYSRGKDFSYKSWLRAFIFANSDDPLRIISWISRNYVYRDRKWDRHRNKLRWGRLIVPLFARSLILIASIVSVGISIPTTKRLSGCSKGDYRLLLNENAARFTNVQIPACIDVPITSQRGEPLVKVSYCICKLLHEDDLGANVGVNYNSDDGAVEVTFSNGTNHGGFRSYVEWKKDGEDVVFRSQLRDSLDIDSHMRVAINAIQKELGSNCAGRTSVQERERRTSLSDCEFPSTTRVGHFLDTINSHMINAMQWDKTQLVQPRVEIRNLEEPRLFNECVSDVDISKPLVNILPLTITLVCLVVVNIIVSLVISRHGRGNALDAGFHLIKDTLGHDCTSNPLEENVDRDEVKEVGLRKWRCGVAGAHYGFIGRTGDIPVEEFADGLIVCGCSRVGDDLEEGRKLPNVSEGSSSALIPPMSYGNAGV